MCVCSHQGRVRPGESVAHMLYLRWETVAALIILFVVRRTFSVAVRGTFELVVRALLFFGIPSTIPVFCVVFFRVWDLSKCCVILFRDSLGTVFCRVFCVTACLTSKLQVVLWFPLGAFLGFDGVLFNSVAVFVTESQSTSLFAVACFSAVETLAVKFVSRSFGFVVPFWGFLALSQTL